MTSYDELKALIDQRGVHAVFGEPGEGFAIEQNSAELAEFLVAMQEIGVSSVLEIGTGYKAGLARFLHDDLDWKVTSVDIKDYGHAFSGITFLNGSNGRLGIDNFDPFDLVIIDASHEYEDVKYDHAFWGRVADKVIAFHDIAGLRDCEGVKQYWDEIAHDTSYTKKLPTPVYEGRTGYYEIIADTPERGGIGYIVLSEVQDEAPVEVEAEVDKPAPKLKATPRKRTPAKKPVAKTAKK